MASEIKESESPPSQSQRADPLQSQSAAKLNKVYVFFWHAYSSVMYSLYEIEVPKLDNTLTACHAPDKATQAGEMENPKKLLPVLELKSGEYPDGMSCVSLGSELYFFGGEFNMDNSYIDEDVKKNFKASERDVFPRQLLILDLSKVGASGDEWHKLLVDGEQMRSGKARPHAFVAEEKIYVIGSTIESSISHRSKLMRIENLDSFKSFEVYDPKIGKWDDLPYPPIGNAKTRWVGHAIVRRKALLVAWQGGEECLYCFDLVKRCWTDASIPFYPENFSGRTEFVEDTLYGCYHNTIAAIAPVEETKIEKEEKKEKVEAEEGEKMEAEKVKAKETVKAEEEDEDAKEFGQGWLLKDLRLHVLSEEMGMDAIFNVPPQLQSSSSLLHLGNRYFCYVKSGMPPNSDDDSDDVIKDDMKRFISIVIFQALGKKYEDGTGLLQAQFLYSAHYEIPVPNEGFIDGCFFPGSTTMNKRSSQKDKGKAPAVLPRGIRKPSIKISDMHEGISIETVSRDVKPTDRRCLGGPAMEFLGKVVPITRIPAETMAGVFLGQALATTIPQVALDRQASLEAIDYIKGRKLNDELLQKLKVMLLSAKSVLIDAEEKQFTNPAVKNWLDELKDAVYVADDLLDEIATEALRSKSEAEFQTRTRNVWRFVSTSVNSFDKKIQSKNSFDKKIRSKLKNIQSILQIIIEQKNVHNLKEVAGGVPLPPRQLTTSCPEEYGVYGRDIDREEIFKKLQLGNANGDEICVVPIVGMGGVGKTTLARLVYNDGLVKDYFDIRAWVCVSDTFDGFRIAKTILEEITLFESNISLNLLQNRIRESLKGKRFLLVLDDVWNENYITWDEFLTMFRCGAKETKIIITTRSEIVASIVQPISIHHLMQLSEEECWLLFAKHAFNGKLSENSDIELIGREIVRKCKGLPLAAKALGGMLRFNQDLREWNHILENDIWDLPVVESSILPALRLSYDYLPSHLKRCFTYCSIFPKDYEFSKEELVLLWMAEDLLLKPKGNGSLEEIGEQYFDELLLRSFFQQSRNDELCFIMHDLFNDLAKFISGEFCFRLEIDNLCKSTKKMRHLSYFQSKFDVPKKFEVFYEAKNLRTFLGLKLPSVSNLWRNFISTMEINDLLCTFKCLRVLSLSLYKFMKVLPDSIGNLKHLRYLNLNDTDIKGLPDSVCGLYNLQILLLRNCRFLLELPTNMGRLVNLRHLDIRGTHLKGMPINMGKLRSLQNLSAFYVGKGEHSGSNIKELGELPHLSGSMCISDLENVCQTRDAKEVNLKDKKGLSELELKWEGGRENYDSEHEREVLEQLCPHTNLKSLSIISYYGAEYPSWLGACSFSNMVSLKLDDCRYCFSLPSLGQLPALKELSIEGLYTVLCVDSKFYGDGSCATNKPFKSLEKLTFISMLEWKEWFTFEGEDGGGDFPTLRELRIINCPKLTGNLPSLLPSLSVIEIEDCPQLVASLPSPSALHELALTNCDKVALEELSPKLQSLGIGGCHVTRLEGGLPTTLKTLQINGALQLPGSHYYPSIESLNVNRGPGSLWSLPLEFFPKLKSIEIRYSDNLESLSASDKSLLDLTSLTKLTIDNCPNFVSFPSGGLCAPNLTQISISYCEKLKSLAEGMHTLLPSLLYLKLWGCPELESFPEGGLPSNLQILLIVRCDKLFLRRMEWGLQSLHSLREIIIQYHGREVGSFPEEALLPPSLICLNISFPHLTSLNGRGFQHLTLLKQLEILVCDNLQRLPEEGFPASLSILDIYECPMLKKRYRRKNGKEWRKISRIPIIKIDFEVIT